MDPSKRVYAGFLDCARKTAAEGLPALYRGFTPGITRAMLVNGFILTGFTAAKRVLDSS